MKKKIVFIVNPISGTHDKRNILNLVKEYLDDSKFAYAVCETKYAGHAPLLVKEQIEQGCDAIIAIGGDGTVNEIARALVHTNVPLGVIPCGSGNGLARHLRIPMDPVGAINVINDFQVECLDYGIINEVPFFCTCGVGFDAFVSSKFANSEKRGVLTYLENALIEGVKYKPDTYEIKIDGEASKYKAFLIACANASHYGNNAYIAPHASMSDGVMDVTIMEPFTILEAPQIAIQLFNKTLNHNTRIKTFRCKHVQIHREREGVIHFDGEPVIAGKDLDVRLIEKGFNVIVNVQKDKGFNISQKFVGIYDEFVRRSSLIREKNLKRIESFNKEVIRRIKEDLEL